MTINHGTSSGYARCQPKCEVCKKWRREYIRGYRKDNRSTVRDYNRLYAEAMRVLKRRYEDEFLLILGDLRKKADSPSQAL